MKNSIESELKKAPNTKKQANLADKRRRDRQMNNVAFTEAMDLGIWVCCA